VSKRSSNGRSSIYIGVDGVWHGWVTMGVKRGRQAGPPASWGKTAAAVTNKVRDLDRVRDAGIVAKPGRPPKVEQWMRIDPRACGENHRRRRCPARCTSTRARVRSPAHRAARCTPGPARAEPAANGSSANSRAGRPAPLPSLHRWCRYSTRSARLSARPSSPPATRGRTGIWSSHDRMGGPLTPMPTGPSGSDSPRRPGVRDSRVHDARHTAATLLLEQAVDIRVVQDVLGHSTLAVTRRYTHVTNRSPRTPPSASAVPCGMSRSQLLLKLQPEPHLGAVASADGHDHLRRIRRSRAVPGAGLEPARP